jgi:hypothetical protein
VDSADTGFAANNDVQNASAMARIVVFLDMIILLVEVMDSGGERQPEGHESSGHDRSECWLQSGLLEVQPCYNVFWFLHLMGS